MDAFAHSSGEFYFDEAIAPNVAELLATAAQHYGTEIAELKLLQAYFYAPEQLTVLVALYRYFYYQQRYQDALIIAERAITLALARLDLPTQWQELSELEVSPALSQSMTLTRFLLLALKGAGYLLLRLGDYPQALQYFEKIAEIDTSNRLGITELLAIARAEVTKLAVQQAGANVRFMRQ